MADETFVVPAGQPSAPGPFSGQRGRLLLLGGAGVAVAAVILLARRGIGGGGDEPTDNSDPGVAGADVGIALGSLEQQIRERSGNLERLFADMSADDQESILGAIEASQRSSDDRFDGLTDRITDQFDDAQFNISADVRGQALNLANEGKSPEQRRYNTWQYARSLSTTPARKTYYDSWLRQAGIDPETGDALG